MARYWMMRVDHWNAGALLWTELQAGRLRQGWGYRADQDLVVLEAKKKSGVALTEHQTRTWRGNRRMLPSQTDGIAQGDVILVPHLPVYGRWSAVRVTGGYRFEIPAGAKDYGHILPVELLSRSRSIHPHDHVVSARLRQTAKARQRLWSLDALGSEVERVLADLAKPEPSGPVDSPERLDVILSDLENHALKQLKHHFTAAEFEAPCVRLLEAMYGAGRVQHTGGKSENGADAICTHTDPSGIEHKVAVQIKMWAGVAEWCRPLEQIEQAVESYERITGGLVLTTALSGSPTFEAKREELEGKLGISIAVVYCSDLVRLFLRHLPGIIEGDSEVGARVKTTSSVTAVDASRTFASVLSQDRVSKPTEDTDATGLAWEIAQELGIRLARTFRLPDAVDGSQQVLFVVRGRVSEEIRAALLARLTAHSGGLRVSLEGRPVVDIDLQDEPERDGLAGLVARFVGS